MTKAPILAAAMLLFVWAVPAAADFADGLAAFDGGDYATAYREWADLAAQGDAEAQVALAGMYAAGVGVRRDDIEAAKWYRRAAEQGHVVGQLNLGDMYFTGRGVARDYPRAYLWLSLAAAQGHPWAAERAAAVAREMTPDGLAEAEGMVRAWRGRDP